MGSYDAVQSHLALPAGMLPKEPLIQGRVLPLPYGLVLSATGNPFLDCPLSHCTTE